MPTLIELQELHQAWLNADVAFNKALRAQFPKSHIGDVRYDIKRHNPETKIAGENFLLRRAKYFEAYDAFIGRK